MLAHDFLQAAVVVCHVDDELLVAHPPLLLRAAFDVALIFHFPTKHVPRTPVLQHVLRF